MWDWIVHHGKRVARITSGTVLLIVGAILSVPGVPGPGVLVMFAGLSILAVDFVWAHRLKTRIKEGASKALNKVRGKKSG
jgi:membrane protein implicated in regulation of membrane protease activity